MSRFLQRQATSRYELRVTLLIGHVDVQLITKIMYSDVESPGKNGPT